MKFTQKLKIKNKRKLLKLIAGIALAVVFIFAAIWIYFENKRIDVTNYDVCSSKLPESFEGFTIVQISDFHNSVFDNNNDILIKKVKAENPNIIVLTGDYIDSRKTDVGISVSLTERLVRIAPTYYITGNHEARIPEALDELTENFNKLGVHILRNSAEEINYNGGVIQIIGVDDPDFIAPEKNAFQNSEEMLNIIGNLKNNDEYTILLSHRREIFDTYQEAGVDLVLSGHAHGGQFRLPFLGALYAPSEGLFPKHAEGMQTEGNMTMVVSRGLGQSVIPFRINNSPELVTVKLGKTEK